MLATMYNLSLTYTEKSIEMTLEKDFLKKKLQAPTKIEYIYYQSVQFYGISLKKKWENSLSL